MCIDKGYIKDDDNKFEDVYRADSHLNMPQITKEELKYLMDSFQLYFKLPTECYWMIEKHQCPQRMMRMFNEKTNQELKWNFNKKEEWWKE
jgi:hypothetical protein